MQNVCNRVQKQIFMFEYAFPPSDFKYDVCFPRPLQVQQDPQFLESLRVPAKLGELLCWGIAAHSEVDYLWLAERFWSCWTEQSSCLSSVILVELIDTRWDKEKTEDTNKKYSAQFLKDLPWPPPIRTRSTGTMYHCNNNEVKGMTLFSMASKEQGGIR